MQRLGIVENGALLMSDEPHPCMKWCPCFTNVYVYRQINGESVSPLEYIYS